MSRDSILVTTSWDDGHPADQRIADLLTKHGLAGTFFIPSRNNEGRPVLEKTELRALARNFEIGGHGLDHVRLDRMSFREMCDQIATNKAKLEDDIGRPLNGFCYVLGKYNDTMRAAVEQLGYSYARTIRPFACNGDLRPYELPTTMQMFPHSNWTRTKNLIKGGGSGFEVFKVLCRARGGISGQVAAVLEYVERSGRMFHIWGHSWEIEELNLWEELDHALGLIASCRSAVPVTNAELVRALART